MGKKADVKETPQERAFAEVAQQQMADYRKRWLPLQRKLAEDIQQAAKPDSFEREQAAGKVATDTAIRFGEAKGGVEKALTNAGAGPGTGKFKMAAAGMGADEATSRGLGYVAADQAIDDAYLEGLGMIASMGRGERQGAVQGMGQIARQSGMQAQQDAQMAMQNRMGNAQLVSQVAGFGLAGGFKGMPMPGGPSTSTVGTMPMGPGQNPSTVGMSF
jgi:hypothetical protein